MTEHVYPFHPLADRFELMKGGDFDELVEDIRAHGLNEPITLYEEMILEGRNRARACAEAGVDPVYRHFAGSHAEAVAYVISANLHRRHLSPERKRELIEELLKASPEKSDRQIATQAKTDHKVVGRARKRLEATGASPQLKKRVGKDGKARRAPAKRKKAEPPAPMPDPEEDAAEQTLEEHWQNSLASLCGEVISWPAYRNKHFPGWEKFDCPSYIRKLVKEAAAVLNALLKTKSEPPPEPTSVRVETAPATDDPGEMPDFLKRGEAVLP